MPVALGLVRAVLVAVHDDDRVNSRVRKRHSAGSIGAATFRALLAPRRIVSHPRKTLLMTVRPLSSLSLSKLAPMAFALFAACADQGGDTTLFFEPVSTKQAVTASAIIDVQERWLTYLASELETGAGGTDYNADGDVNDQIAFLINMVGRTTAGLQTAAKDVALISGQLFLVVDEAEDEVDWNNDGDGLTMTWDDLVLLHVACAGASTANLNYVATLESGFAGGSTARRMLAADTRLYFIDDPATLAGVNDTTLNYVATSAPTTPVRVLNADGANTLSPSLLTLEEDLLFLTLDENLEGRNLNGDSDTTDAFVLALVDANVAAPLVREVGLAARDANVPVRALKRATSDWIVAYLVDEQAQGAVSRNAWLTDASLPDSLLPGHCVGSAIDGDATDQVLGYLEYASWVGGGAKVNTGLAGHRRALATKNGSAYFVATICPEAGEGNCNLNSLNDDDDFVDDVLRWIRVETPLGNSGIYGDSDGLVAVADVAGGTRGVTDLAGRWIVVVDEDADNRDHDGMPAVDNDVIGWIDPLDGNSALFTFDHGSGTGFQPAGTAWMSERESRDRALIAFQEKVANLALNSSDTDKLDSAPSFARFDPLDLDDLDFPGPAIAVADDNAGIVIQNGFAFYRVDEAADNRNWNGDSDKLDFVLFRSELANLGNTNFVATLSDLDRPAVVSDSGNIGAAFIALESSVNVDFNADGDTNDFVLRWMRIGP